MICATNANKAKRLVTLIVTAIALGFLVPSATAPAWADDAFTKGVNTFNKRDYKSALVQFEAIVKREPRNAYAVYYVAICNQYLGKPEVARKLYRNLVDNFPGTSACRMAETALGLQPPIGIPNNVNAASTTSATSTGVPNSTAVPTGPAQETVFIDASKQGHMLVPATVNGHSIKMLIDTGTSACLFGKNHLKQLGINEPTGPATGKAYTSAGHPYNVWQVPVDVQIGNIKQRLTVNVQEKQDWDPLLGWSFFRGQSILFNNTRGQLGFYKAMPRNEVPSGAVHVPLEVDARNIAVRVKINGIETPANIDTGAQLCRVYQKDSSRLGVVAPPGAKPDTSITDDGTPVKVTPTTIQALSLGTLTSNGVRANLVDVGNGNPSLGMSYLSELNMLLDIDGKRAVFWR